MQEAEKPSNEAARLAELLSLRILDTDNDPDFDDIAKLAKRICDVPIVLISLVDAERQWFKSKIGVSICETPRSMSFCAYAIHGTEVFIIPDTAEDERFKDSPLVVGPPFIRFYAGAPLIDSNGLALGTLCVIDTKPRKLTEDQLDSIRKLARQVVVLLELRKSSNQRLQYMAEVKDLGRLVLEQKDRLRYLEKVHVLSEMSSGICHEINNPLAIIALASSSLKKSLEDPFDQKTVDRFLKMTDAGTARIAKIVDSLRTYARSHDKLTRENLRLSDVLESTLALCDERLKLLGVRLEVEQDAGIVVHGSESQLMQLLLNLIMNARDAVEKLPEKWIRISMRRAAPGMEVRLRVTDSGRGIPADVAEKMLLPFFTTKDVGKGTGLGLSICYSIVDEAGGRLGYELFEGHTSFLVELPTVS